MGARVFAAAALVSCLYSSTAVAQPEVSAGSSLPAPAPLHENVIPPLTPIVIEIGVQVGSAVSRTGDMFPFKLRLPVSVNGRELLPVGTTGTGEVVWAKKAGGSGAPGELVLAARWLTVGGRQLRLRSMNFQNVGDSRYADVNRLMIASAAALPLASVLGFAIKGKDIQYPAGTIAGAKTAEAFEVGASSPAQVNPAETNTEPAHAALSGPTNGRSRP